MRGGSIAIALGATLAFTTHAAHAEDVRVHIDHVDVDSQIVLERRIPDVDLWESVCRAPCDIALPLEGPYRISGHGLRPSVPISFTASPVVHLDASRAYSSGYYGSMLLAILGPIVMVAGTFTAIAGASSHQEFEEPPCPNGVTCGSPPPQSNATTIAGIGSLGVGVAMLIAGVFGLTATSHSTVRQVGALTVTGRGIMIRF